MTIDTRIIIVPEFRPNKLMKPINTKNTIIGCTGNKYDFSTKNGQADRKSTRLNSSHVD